LARALAELSRNGDLGAQTGLRTGLDLQHVARLGLKLLGVAGEQAGAQHAGGIQDRRRQREGRAHVQRPAAAPKFHWAQSRCASGLANSTVLFPVEKDQADRDITVELLGCARACRSVCNRCTRSIAMPT